MIFCSLKILFPISQFLRSLITPNNKKYTSKEPSIQFNKCKLHLFVINLFLKKIYVKTFLYQLEFFMFLSDGTKVLIMGLFNAIRSQRNSLISIFLLFSSFLFQNFFLLFEGNVVKGFVYKHILVEKSFF